MSHVEEQVEQMLESPLGCAFLAIANASGLTTAEIIEPRNSILLAATATNAIEVWRTDHEALRSEALRQGQELRTLAVDILSDPGAEYWFGPLDPTQQVFVPHPHQPPPESASYFPPETPLETWMYAEKLKNSLFTSTLWNGEAHNFVAFDQQICDFGIGYDRGAPYPAWLLSADPNSAVYEITSAQSWHDLAARYPTEGDTNENTPPHTQEPGRITPDWQAVSADWDAVHLTLGGLLTADQVLVRSDAGWTYHWSWSIEQTLWLKWKFDAPGSVKQLPDHEPNSHSPLFDDPVTAKVFWPDHKTDQLSGA